MGQGLILLIRNMACRLGPLEWAISIQLCNPMRFEELKYLLFDLNAVLHHTTITFLQLPDIISRLSNHHRSMKEFGVPITLSGPLNLGLLPP